MIVTEADRLSLLKRIAIRKKILKSVISPNKILLIGEQVGRPELHEDYPFCAVTASAGWLNRLLDDHKILEQDLYWINALNRDNSKKNLIEIVERLQPFSVFALGKIAEKLCIDSNVEHIAIPHPQYWKRFKSGQEYPLLEKLQETLRKKNEI